MHCYNARHVSRVVAIDGKAMVLKWNVAELGQFPMINVIDAEHIYDSVCRSFCRKFVSSCLLLLLLLGCDTFLQVSTQMGKKLLRNIIIIFFFLQKTSWICDFSNLEMLRLDSMVPVREFSI